MEFPANLNKRHKVALFLTLLAAGASLVLGVAATQTVGIVLLGIAFAWALGSNNRLVYVSFITVGLLLTIEPVVRDWYNQANKMKKYREGIAQFERKIPDLAKQYPAFSSVLKAKTSNRDTDMFDPVARFKARYAGVENDSDEKVRAYLSEPNNFRLAFPEYKSLEDTKIRETLSQHVKRLRRLAEQRPKRPNSASDFQYVFLPDGSYGEFRGDATDEQIVAKVEAMFPGTFNDRRPIENEFRYVMLPDGNYLKSPSTLSDEKLRTEVARNFPLLPRWEIDAYIAGVDLYAVPSLDFPGVEPEPYSLKHSLLANWMVDLPGLILLATGFGLFLRFRLESMRAQN